MLGPPEHGGESTDQPTDRPPKVRNQGPDLQVSGDLIAHLCTSELGRLVGWSEEVYACPVGHQGRRCAKGEYGENRDDAVTTTEPTHHQAREQAKRDADGEQPQRHADLLVELGLPEEHAVRRESRGGWVCRRYPDEPSGYS